MPKYVDAEYILKCAEMSFKNAGISHSAFEKIKKWLNRADAVVICKECVYAHQYEGFECLSCTNEPSIYSWVSDDYFCADGERKEVTE